MTSWADLRGSGVGVWGVGVEGRASLRRLAQEGVAVRAVVAASAGLTDTGHDVVALDDGGLDRLAQCDVVLKSPGISPYGSAATALESAGVELVGGLGLWLAGAPSDRVVCVTGTKGKSTTAAVVAALARGLGHSCLLGGNIGVAPWDPEVEPAEWYVVEVSSYQARDVTKGSKVVVVTSLSQDHLDWHGSYEAYVRDKLSLCLRPRVQTVLVPAGDAELEMRRAALGPHVQTVPDQHADWVETLGLIGEHNRRNALLAHRALFELGVPGADDPGAIHAAARTYTPLRSRLTPIGEVGGVRFVDDSLSTNTLPTLAAIRAFEGVPLALLVGGFDRGIDYEPLAQGLARHHGELLVLALPENGPRIAEVIRTVAPRVRVETCTDLAQAVERGHAWARPSGVVLLSPAAPSFGRFENYAARADAFEAAMHTLGRERFVGG
jgi:UDP-N-acetylmuramoylalanine--D-glutamate ligase